MKIFRRISTYLKDDIWRIRASRLSPAKAFQTNLIRAFLLATRGFIDGKCQLRASALTFYTMLSIVPIFAMLFGVARGFGMERLFEERLLDEFPQNHEAIVHIINFSTALLENTKTSTVAGFGVVALFWIVIRVLGQIEFSFNEIWHVSEPRSFARKFSDYLSLMLICPVLLILSGSFTVFITAYLKDISMRYSGAAYLMIAFFFGVKIMAYVIPWLLFTFIYVFMPNTKVKINSGVIAGLVAGSAYQILQWAYIKFQLMVTSYNAVYGTFAALPLFLIWLQTSWLVTLFGAELCYAFQNSDSFEFKPDFEKISASARRTISLAVAAFVTRNFTLDRPPVGKRDIAVALDIPEFVVENALNELVRAEMLAVIESPSEWAGKYMPAIPHEELTVARLFAALDKYGNDRVPHLQSTELAKYFSISDECMKQIEKSSCNLKLSEIS